MGCKKHLFITGEKGIGKSSYLQFLIAGEDRVDGFLTIRSDQFMPSKPSVHLLRITCSEVRLTEDNLLFYCEDKRKRSNVDRFNRIGARILDQLVGQELDCIVMDELGPYESAADEFCCRIEELLKGNIPIIGVIQKSPGRLYDLITNHTSVRVIEINRENRDRLRQYSWRDLISAWKEKDLP